MTLCDECDQSSFECVELENPFNGDVKFVCPGCLREHYQPGINGGYDRVK